MQNDGKTGVLALGSFSGAAIDTMMSGLLQGLVTLKSQGATQLIVDVVGVILKSKLEGDRILISFDFN